MEQKIIIQKKVLKISISHLWQIKFNKTAKSTGSKHQLKIKSNQKNPKTKITINNNKKNSSCTNNFVFLSENTIKLSQINCKNNKKDKINSVLKFLVLNKK